MTMTPVPGWQVGLTVNLVDIGVRGNVTGLSLGKNAPPKARFGQAWRNVLAGGQKFASFSASGHIDEEGPVAALVTAFNAATAVAFTLEIGDDGSATEVGDFTGTCVIETLDLSADAEGEWEWSINVLADGMATFTPPA